MGAGFILLSTSRVYSIRPLAALPVRVVTGAFVPVTGSDPQVPGSMGSDPQGLKGPPDRGSVTDISGMDMKAAGEWPAGLSIDGVSASIPLIKDGKLRALAKLNNRPLPSLPDLKPLSVAANLPELGEISTWAGLVAPAGTPAAVVERIQRDVAAVAADPEVGAKLQGFGIVAVSSTPSEFDRYYRGEIDRWSKVFKDSGITLE